jgi:hypothetical protein
LKSQQTAFELAINKVCSQVDAAYLTILRLDHMGYPLGSTINDEVFADTWATPYCHGIPAKASAGLDSLPAGRPCCSSVRIYNY